MTPTKKPEKITLEEVERWSVFELYLRLSLSEPEEQVEILRALIELDRKILQERSKYRSKGDKISITAML